MQTTVRQIDDLAGRIERAYLLRRPGWVGTGPSSTVWTVAATRLMHLHAADPSIPVDPELFVASQPVPSGEADPWHELARPAAARRYERCVLRIVSALRRELRAEVVFGKSRVRQGESLESVLSARSLSFSPLGRFILACVCDRSDLAERFRADAQAQHRSCPLYRLACQTLLRPDAYPVLELIPGLEFRGREASGGIPAFSLN
jgi:hypothetical protein